MVDIVEERTNNNINPLIYNHLVKTGQIAAKDSLLEKLKLYYRKQPQAIKNGINEHDIMLPCFVLHTKVKN